MTLAIDRAHAEALGEDRWERRPAWAREAVLRRALLISRVFTRWGTTRDYERASAADTTPTDFSGHDSDDVKKTWAVESRHAEAAPINKERDRVAALKAETWRRIEEMEKVRPFVRRLP